MSNPNGDRSLDTQLGVDLDEAAIVALANREDAIDARAIGQPSAVRAVGAANGRNPISIIAPCHRVIGANGALTGFAGGLKAKEYLLALEKRRDVSAAA